MRMFGRAQTVIIEENLGSSVISFQVPFNVQDTDEIYWELSAVVC